MTGDASVRRYFRLIGPGQQSAILMQTAPDARTVSALPGADNSEETRFFALANTLLAAGLPAPKTYFSAPSEGLFLIEDLGQSTFAQWLVERPDDEALLYKVAGDTLAKLAKLSPPGLPVIGPDEGAQMISPLFEFYAPSSPKDASALKDVLRQTLRHLTGPPNVFALRDFHAENLIWRPEWQGTDRAGLLDFQDAVLAPAGYDLASLLSDARRDVSASVQEALLAQYAQATGSNVEMLGAACAALSVMRNLRILGIFANLVQNHRKPRYQSLMPRVHAHLRHALQHPALADLRDPALRCAPKPAC